MANQLIDIPMPQGLEPRLQMRYKKIVLEHLNTNSEIAAGLRALPGEGKSFASTQGAYRFYSNPDVSLSSLAKPLEEQAREFIKSECCQYALIVHDWSNLDYDRQRLRKTDQIKLGYITGYEMQSALLLSDRTGMPLSPISLNLTSSQGIYSTESDNLIERKASLDQVSGTMEHINKKNFPLPVVNIIDREADSVFHLRQWDERGDLFVVRANDHRYARWENESRLRFREIKLEAEFKSDKAVEINSKIQAQAFVWSTMVTLTDPAYRHLKNEKRRRIPGRPLLLRLIIVQMRLPDETVYAEWYLLTNLPASVPASMIAEWYYWRWSIESMHKLIKSAGLHIEQWQQETAITTAKRILVAFMACVVVWQIQRINTPQIENLKSLLLRLSGRQIRRGQAPASALLSGLWQLLGTLDILQHYDVKELLEMASVLPIDNMLKNIHFKQGFSP